MAQRSNVIFEKEVISYSNNKILQLKPFIMHLITHKVVQHVCFFHYSLNFDDQLSPNVQNLLFYAYVGIHQVTVTKGVQCL